MRLPEPRDTWAVLWLLTGAAFALAIAAGSAQAQAPSGLNLARMGVADAEARRVSVTLVPGVRSSADLKDARLIETRRRLARDQPVTLQDLRALADAGDGNAALHLPRRMEAEGIAAEPANLAHYYGLAAATGRVGGLFGLVRILPAIDPDQTSAARLDLLRKTLMAYAIAGNSVAIDAVIRFDRTGHPFGPMPDDIARLARDGRGRGAATVALHLAGDLMQRQWDDPDALSLALGYLQTASDAPSMRVRLIAGNMLPVVEDRIRDLSPTRPEGEG
ncbi:hypothetical protein [Jannaschia sp. 2305UL9-9]|uniref:hypothetical protein n=1 Tax=Jannaschia sp. 2305UL9-9 TaxID=3121638 RepID=UPI0035278780